MHSSVLMNGTLKTYMANCNTSVFLVFYVKCFKKHIFIRLYTSSKDSRSKLWHTHLHNTAYVHLKNQRCSLCPDQQAIYWKMCPVNILQIFFPLFLNTLCFRFLCTLLLTIWSNKCNSVWSSQLPLHTSKRCQHILQENYFPLFHRVLYFSLMSGWVELLVPACKRHRLQRFACCLSKE